jgi:ABC-2 type transporter
MWWTRPSLSVSVNVPFERVLEHVVEHVCGALCGCEPGEDHVQRHADLAVEGDPIGGIGRQLGLSGRPIVGRRRGRGLAPPAARAELVEGEAADDHDQPGPHVVDLIDYMSFVAVATIGLLVPLSCMQSGLGVLVDRVGGGLRDLLAAPVSRPLIVAGNLVVAVALSAFQVAALLGASALRGAEFQLEVTGVMWFAAATLGFAVAMYGAAEILANRLPTQEEYIGALPAVAIVLFFFAGSLVRYGLVDRDGSGLHDIWGMSNTTAITALSLGVVALFALVLTAVAMRTFRRTAVR